MLDMIELISPFILVNYEPIRTADTIKKQYARILKKHITL